jgi:hypothetical protein
MEDEIILTSEEELDQPFDQLPLPPHNFATNSLYFRHRRTLRHQIILHEVYLQELSEYIHNVRSMIQATRRRIQDMNNQLGILERINTRRRRIRMHRRRNVRVQNQARPFRNNRGNLLEIIVSETRVIFRLNLSAYDFSEFCCPRSYHPGFLCCVCLEDYEKLCEMGNFPLLTACQHQICRNCIEILIRQSVQNYGDVLCPLCRQILIASYY